MKFDLHAQLSPNNKLIRSTHRRICQLGRHPNRSVVVLSSPTLCKVLILIQESRRSALIVIIARTLPFLKGGGVGVSQN